MPPLNLWNHRFKQFSKPVNDRAFVPGLHPNERHVRVETHAPLLTRSRDSQSSHRVVRNRALSIRVLFSERNRHGD